LLQFQFHPEIGVVGTLGHIIDENGKRTWRSIIHSTEANEVRAGFWLRNQLIHTSILARKEVLERVGKYRSKWLYVEDYDLWLRVLGLGYGIMNLPDFSIDYRVREGNITSLKYRKMQWLAFQRLYVENTVYPNYLRRLFCLSVRLALVLIPRWAMKYLK
jgi:GT2 family glycosyltransferase